MKAKIISIKKTPAIFYLLLGAIVFSAVFYVYCVNAAVRNAVVRREALNHIDRLQTQMSELEYRYMANENRMTIESAKLLELVELSQKIFIPRNSSGRELSLYNREP